MTYHEKVYGPLPDLTHRVVLNAHHGYGKLHVTRLPPGSIPWTSWSVKYLPHQPDLFGVRKRGSDRIGQFKNNIYFPLWYPALIFALAGVAAVRLGRQFTIRSAIIATTIVAGLLGMAVIL
ncbi:hypothetical protein [Lacipirellula limnantheis]|nr:hypothetical protein [Lacipirellula limnantheis]